MSGVRGQWEGQVTKIKLQKGKYAFMCFIPDRKGGPLHAAKGMVVETEIR